jgi:hypothetical protein
MGKRHDLTGMVFERLTVIEFMGTNKHHKAKWRCLCSCGTEVIRSGNTLLKGDTRSCGCLRKEVAGTAKIDPSKVGTRLGMLYIESLIYDKEKGKCFKCICDCGNEKLFSGQDLNGTRYTSCGCKKYKTRVSNKDSVIKKRFYQYKRNADKKGRKFELTLAQFTDIVTAPCQYCGELDRKGQSRESRFPLCNKDFYTKEDVNGVDRVDSSLGYVAGNVVPCCGCCNRMKSDLPEKSWLTKIEKIYLKSMKGKQDVTIELGSLD